MSVDCRGAGAGVGVGGGGVRARGDLQHNPCGFKALEGEGVKEGGKGRESVGGGGQDCGLGLWEG